MDNKGSNKKQPDKLTVEELEEIISSRGFDANYYGICRDYARQFLDTMRELESAKSDIEMLYKSREKFVQRYECLRKKLELLGCVEWKMLQYPNKESAIKESLTTDNPAKTSD